MTKGAGQGQKLLWVGAGFIAIGLVCNPWLLARLLSHDGSIALANTIFIAAFDAVTILIGVALIRGRAQPWAYLGRCYRGLAIFLLNTIVLLVAVNLLIQLVEVLSATRVTTKRAAVERTGLFQEDGAPRQNGRRTPYQMQWFDMTAYEGHDPVYVGRVLDEFQALAKKGFIYQPWVQNAETPYAGQLVTVELDATGLPVRRTKNPDQDASTEAIWVYTLGGSTTFGYHVSDEHTWPTYLSQILNEKARDQGLDRQVRVVNYGRSGYTPSQEQALITDLLKCGHRPSLVIFMNGVNWGPVEDIPYHSIRVERAVVEAQFGTRGPGFSMNWLPMARLARSIRSIAQPDSAPAARAETYRSFGFVSSDRDVDWILRRFETCRDLSRAACNLFGVRTLFFLQPDAVHNYPFNLFRPSVPKKEMQELVGRRASREKFYEKAKLADDVIYLGDLFEAWGNDRKAVVDNCHYNPGFGRFLAEKIGALIDLRALPASHQPIHPSMATGGVRRSAAAQAQVIERSKRR